MAWWHSCSLMGLHDCRDLLICLGLINNASLFCKNESGHTIQLDVLLAQPMHASSIYYCILGSAALTIALLISKMMDS